VYAPSRVARLAQANVVPILKTMAYRDRLIPHVVAALDDHGHLDTARLGEPCRYITAAFLRNVARQLRRHAGRPISSITQIQSAPTTPRLARLGAVDAQLALLDDAARGGVWLRLKLPTRAAPAGRASSGTDGVSGPTSPTTRSATTSCPTPITISSLWAATHTWTSRIGWPGISSRRRWVLTPSTT
jgi:hypothetical protein